MRTPDGSHGPELGGAKDAYIYGVMVSIVLLVGGFGPLIALSMLNETSFEVPSEIRAGFAAAGAAGFVIGVISVLLIKADPPPNPY